MNALHVSSSSSGIDATLAPPGLMEPRGHFLRDEERREAWGTNLCVPSGIRLGVRMVAPAEVGDAARGGALLQARVKSAPYRIDYVPQDQPAERAETQLWDTLASVVLRSEPSMPAIPAA